jgi:MFS family permease
MALHTGDRKRPTRRPRYFYGWNIVFASFLARLSYAEHFTSTLGLFMKPLQGEFGWSRSAIAGVQTVARLAEALFAPLVGPLVDRYGARLLMPIGSVIAGLAMLGVTRIDTIWQFYMLRGILAAIGFTLLGRLVIDVTISNWFVRKRGRAIGISRSGANLSNFIMAPLTVFVIATYGWRTMFVVFACVTWFFVLIPSVTLMRRRPEDMGYHPDGVVSETAEMERGRATSKTGEPSPTTEPVWSRREAMMTKSFWLLATAYAINSIAFQGINISLAPYIQDLGYADTMLAAVITFRAVVMTTTVLIMGVLAERADRVIVRVLPFMILALGAFFLLMGRQPVFLWLGVMLYGLGNSGVNVTQEVLWANYFGRLSLGRVRSLGYTISFGFGAAGPVAMNLVYDVFETYRPAFWVIMSLFIVAASLMAAAGPAKARRYDAA